MFQSPYRRTSRGTIKSFRRPCRTTRHRHSKVFIQLRWQLVEVQWQLISTVIPHCRFELQFQRATSRQMFFGHRKVEHRLGGIALIASNGQTRNDAARRKVGSDPIEEFTDWQLLDPASINNYDAQENPTPELKLVRKNVAFIPVTFWGRLLWTRNCFGFVVKARQAFGEGSQELLALCLKLDV